MSRSVTYPSTTVILSGVLLLAATSKGLAQPPSPDATFAPPVQTSVALNDGMQEKWNDIPLFAQASTTGSTLTTGVLSSQDPDDRRPQKDQRTTIELFSRPLTVTGELQTETEFERNFRLDSQQRTETDMDNTLKLELLYGISETATAYLESTAVYQYEDDSATNQSDTDAFLELNEYWLAMKPSQKAGFRVGRQDIRDDRQWWWDEELLSVRFDYADHNQKFMLAYADEITPARLDDNDVRPEEKNIQRIIGQFSYRWNKRHEFNVYALQHDDRSSTPIAGEIGLQDREDETDSQLNWLGIRATGRQRKHEWGRMHYWFDFGYVWGDASVVDYDDISDSASVVDEVEVRTVQGSGVDLGATWVSNRPDRSRFTFGYARGSGDRDTDNDTDKAYRQTGLQDNDVKFRGDIRIKRYGELFDPDLTNLEVISLGYGRSILDRGSLELFFHQYRQAEADQELPASNLRGEMNGRGVRIGSELDLALGYQHSNRLESELLVSYFWPGSSFAEPHLDHAWFAGFELEYNF